MEFFSIELNFQNVDLKKSLPTGHTKKSHNYIVAYYYFGILFP